MVMFLSYFFGCWWLPVFLSILDFDFVKFGEAADDETNESGKEEEGVTATAWHPENTDDHPSEEIGNDVDC